MSTLEQSVSTLTKFLNLEYWTTHTNTNTLRLHHEIPPQLPNFFMAGVAYPLVFLAWLLCLFDEICHHNTLFYMVPVVWRDIHIHCKSIVFVELWDDCQHVFAFLASIITHTYYYHQLFIQTVIRTVALENLNNTVYFIHCSTDFLQSWQPFM